MDDTKVTITKPNPAPTTKAAKTLFLSQLRLYLAQIFVLKQCNNGSGDHIGINLTVLHSDETLQKSQNPPAP